MKETLTIRMDKTLKETVSIQAKKEQSTISEIIRLALEEYLGLTTINKSPVKATIEALERRISLLEKRYTEKPTHTPVNEFERVKTEISADEKELYTIKEFAQLKGFPLNGFRSAIMRSDIQPIKEGGGNKGAKYALKDLVEVDYFGLKG